MKKWVSVILACVLYIASVGFTYSSEKDIQPVVGYEVEVNGETTQSVSVIRGGVHCVPLRKVFENLGAHIFYRGRDNLVLAITRDSDMIYHHIGSNTIVVNGIEKTFEYSSFLENGETYIPIHMVTAALCPDGIFYENNTISIYKYFFDSDAHKLIADVLDMKNEKGFNPENFKKYISYHVTMPNLSMKDVIWRVNIGLDRPFYENVATIADPYQLLVLVNKYNKLPDGFSQYNLVSMSSKYANGSGHLLAGVAYENYVKMADDARKAGLSLVVVSSYRTENYQRSLYNNRVYTTGKINADNYSARPGFSEHQTGLAVDINSTKGWFENTAESRWLQAHAHEYGFILRYPQGKTWITGYAYEPWHYRYVGCEAAKIIYEEGITYEEFYAKYVANEFK